jgi:hypothetical protein
MKVYKHSLKSGLLDGSTASCEQLVLIENTANILTYDMSYPRPLNLKPLFFWICAYHRWLCRLDSECNRLSKF